MSALGDQHGGLLHALLETRIAGRTMVNEVGRLTVDQPKQTSEDCKDDKFPSYGAPIVCTISVQATLTAMERLPRQQMI